MRTFFSRLQWIVLVLLALFVTSSVFSLSRARFVIRTQTAAIEKEIEASRAKILTYENESLKRRDAEHVDCLSREIGGDGCVGEFRSEWHTRTGKSYAVQMLRDSKLIARKSLDSIYIGLALIVLCLSLAWMTTGSVFIKITKK